FKPSCITEGCADLRSRIPASRSCGETRGTQFVRASHLYDLVVVAVAVDRLVELVQEVLPVARQEVNAANCAFLQAFAGIKGLAENFRVTIDEFAFLRFRARRLGVEFIELMLHL